jgi:hypothetical protein
MNQKLRIIALLTGAATLGCTGNIGGGSHGGQTPGGPDDGNGMGPGPGTGGPGNNNGGAGGGNNNTPPPNTGALDDAKSVPGAAPLRRLTKLEYDNTIRDLLGVASPGGDKLTGDQGSFDSGFATGGSITGSTDARQVMTNAETIADAAIARLPMLLPCSPVPTARAAQDTCADQFIGQFGLRAFRRPLAPAEQTDLNALYKAHRDAALGQTFEGAIGAVITAVLQTPQFLYHWEMAPAGPIKEGALVRLGPYELASKLSYLFWASMPDDALFTAAKDGKLASPDDVAREARRLLASDKAKAGLEDFFLQYLEIGKLGDLEKAPELTMFTPALAQAMSDETRHFVDSLFFGAKANGKLDTLLTSPSSVIDAGLAKLYGVSGFAGTDTKAADFDPTRRAGIFTQAAFLTAKADADTSHPVKRGDAVLRRVLCTELIIPDNLVVPPLPEPRPDQTTRERYSVHSASPCASCHKLIDPVGFSFEHYDAIGAYRDMEVGKPIDSHGALTLAAGELKFDNAVEMMKQLAGTKEVRDCMATQWLRYSLRRREVDGEAPSLNVLQATLGSNADLRELMVAATKARTFTHRAPSPGEVLQ